MSRVLLVYISFCFHCVGLPPRLGRGLAKNPAQTYMEWMHLKGFIGAGALFSALGWALGVLGVLGYVAGDVSSAFSVAVDLVADEDTALFTEGGGLRVGCLDYSRFLCHGGSLSLGSGSG